jgi:hypothetical protein
MEKSSQIAWKIVPLRHFFPLKIVPLIEVLLYNFIGPFYGLSLVSQHAGKRKGRLLRIRGPRRGYRASRLLGEKICQWRIWPKERGRRAVRWVL